VLLQLVYFLALEPEAKNEAHTVMLDSNSLKPKPDLIVAIRSGPVFFLPAQDRPPMKCLKGFVRRNRGSLWANDREQTKARWKSAVVGKDELAVGVRFVQSYQGAKGRIWLLSGRCPSLIFHV
jgi:hypothetical protein